MVRDVGFGQCSVRAPEPRVQRIGNRLGAALAQQFSRLWLQLPRLSLHLIQPGDQGHRLRCDLAAV